MKLQKLFSPFLAFFGLFAGLVASARADIPAIVGTTVAQIQSDANDLFDIMVVPVMIVLGLMIVMKLIKRFGNKI